VFAGVEHVVRWVEAFITSVRTAECVQRFASQKYVITNVECFVDWTAARTIVEYLAGST
jgi:hypothetical protein